MQSDDQGDFRIIDPYAMYFITSTAVGWVDVFSRRQCKDIVIDSLKYCQQEKGLLVYAYVIMESHIHLVVAADPGSDGLSAILRDFKKFTSKKIIKWIDDNPKESRRYWMDVVFKYHGKYNHRNQTYQVWQQHNCPKVCELPKFTMQKINYIHNNPVKAGIVDRAVDYKYNSARAYAGLGQSMLDVIVYDYRSDVGFVPG